jgi:hypothetical protein
MALAATNTGAPMQEGRVQALDGTGCAAVSLMERLQATQAETGNSGIRVIVPGLVVKEGSRGQIHVRSPAGSSSAAPPGVVHSVPAATLSCLQAVCNAANAPNATPGAELQRSAQDQFVQRRPEIIQQVVARVRPRRAMADAHFEGGRGDQQWPAHHEVRGFLTLRLHPDDRDGIAAICSIRNNVVSMRVSRRGETSCGSDPAAYSALMVEIPIGELRVSLHVGRDNIICTASSRKPRDRHAFSKVRPMMAFHCKSVNVLGH